MWDKIWETVRDLLLTFFGPPDIDDEAAFREWLQEALAWLGWIAARTKTTVDDKVHAALVEIVGNDAKWAILYTLLVKLFGDGRVPIGGELEADTNVAETAGKLGMPIGLLIQLILLFLKLLGRE